MNKQRTICLKALLLLTVFSLNMVVSFACSISETVHNNHHAGKSTGTYSHEYKGKPAHNHGSDHIQVHETDHKHNQEADPKHSHHNDEENKNGGDDNCCSGDVIKLQQSDRSISRSIDAPAHTTLLVEHNLFLSIDHFVMAIFRYKYLPQHLRWPPATIPDIRIAIQSFQI